MLRFIPSRTAIWAALAALGGIIIALARRDARKDQQTKDKLEDYEHAQDIADSVAAHRADPKRLRQFEGRGYRD